MKKALFVLLAMLALGSPAFAQQRSANLTTQASTCGTPPAASTAYLFVPVNTANGGATITVSGTWSGTISFFASGDGADTWVALNATPSNSGTAASTTTGNGTWQANIAGYTHVCAAFTTASSGTAVVSLQLSQASARSGGGGGGGGGGISGTVSSPNMPFASGPDTLSDSAFGYDATSTVNPSCNNADSGEPGLYVDSNGATGCFTAAGMWFGPDMGVEPFGNYGLTGFYISDDVSGTSGILGNDGNLRLGQNGGVGGSITLNDATSGSFALATDTTNPVGSALEFTNVNVIGTGTLDMSIFPDDPPMNINVFWSAPGTMTPAVQWQIGPTTAKTIATIVDVDTSTLNPDTTGFPCGPMGLGDGQIAHFSDGDTNVWGATLAGGGMMSVEAFCDGSEWVVMGAKFP